MSRVYIGADWSQIETWLTAKFSGDPQLQADLDGQLVGAPKIHALNAHRLYGIDPADAKTHMIDLQGQRRPAYDGGKRGGHAFNYGMRANKLAKIFWLPLPEAERILDVLSSTYSRIPEWHVELADAVFGSFIYRCPRCAGDGGYGLCPSCSTPKRPVLRVFAEVAREPERMLYTPFGRRRIYLGRRTDAINAVASQLPQSSGASMWNRTLLRLSGYDPATGGEWPTPPGALVWSPRVAAYGTLYLPYETYVSTGTYDSFLVECPTYMAERTLEWVVWTMEQPWPELDGLRIPVEAGIGTNWQDHSKENPNGIQDRDIPVFSASNPF